MQGRGVVADQVAQSRATEWGWFLAWLAVGGCLAFGLAALLTVGIAFSAVAVIAAMFLLRKGPRAAIAGGVTGLALPAFYLAYLNREGPGNVCHATAGGSTCTDEYAPVPFLVVGAILFVAGFLIFLMLERGRRDNG